MLYFEKVKKERDRAPNAEKPTNLLPTYRFPVCPKTTTAFTQYTFRADTKRRYLKWSHTLSYVISHSFCCRRRRRRRRRDSSDFMFCAAHLCHYYGCLGLFKHSIFYAIFTSIFIFSPFTDLIICVNYLKFRWICIVFNLGFYCTSEYYFVYFNIISIPLFIFPKMQNCSLKRYLYIILGYGQKKNWIDTFKVNCII